MFRDFENEIQSLSAELGKNPEDIHTINRHIESVEAYIDSGLLEEYLLKNQRISYSQLLDQKLKILPTDKSTLIKKIRNHLELNEPYEAVEAWEILRENYTDDEDIWIEGVRISVESHDKRRLQDTLAQIKSSEIDWSISGRSRLENWLESK